MEKVQESHSVLDILENFGKYHCYHWILVVLPSMVVTMVNINFVFVAGDLDYRCYIPECDTPESTHHPPIWWPNTTSMDRCSKPVIEDEFHQDGNCSTTSFTSELAADCTQWIYESNNTIVSELNLGCQPWKINLVGMIHSIGMLFSMVIIGWMLDRLGRKPTLIICAVSSVIGHVKAFAVNYNMFVIVEFLEGVVSGGMYLSSAVMMIEFSGKSNRLYSGILLAYAIYFGEVVFAGIAMTVPYWKNLVRIIYSLPLIFPSYVFLIRESPRWQVLNGRSDEAKRTLEIIAKVNKVAISNQELRDIDETKLQMAFNIKSYDVREGFKDILKSKEILKRLGVVSFCRFTVSFVYFGIMINSVFLPGNKYTNFFLSAVMSFPGEFICLYFMNKIGRKLPLILGYFLSGVMCVASGYVPTNWGRVTCFLLGKMVIAACFTGIVTYTMELYPTSTRGMLIGFSSVMSRVGSMVAPLTPMLYPMSPVLPTLLFGGTALVSSVLLTLTPETKDMALSDTIEQVDTIVKAAREEKRATKTRLDSEFRNSMTQSCETVVTHI